MDVPAKVTSKGQVTVPTVVRDALGIKEGDEVVFRVEGNRAVLARTPDFLVGFDSVRCVDPALMLRAIEVYETDRIDFAEAYLVACAES
ncbi:MAG: AbrB/MazE/SpoVT family DNA-binding domain-containing protein [Acidimicrobiales bacterium]